VLELRAVVKDATELLATWDRIAAHPCFRVVSVENGFLYPQQFRDAAAADSGRYDKVAIHVRS
jgi:hypothetical protein